MTTFDTKKLTQDVNVFWFGDVGSPDFGKFRPRWYQKDEAFDQDIEDRFGQALIAAGEGQLNAMAETAEGALALLLVLDQFTRNTRRGQAAMYDNDVLALKMAKEAIEKGFDLDVLPVQRAFFYLPFEHSENLADQRYINRKIHGYGE